MTNFKKCPNGHYYRGVTCPYCETEVYPFGITQTTPTCSKGVKMPRCPHCGSPVRNGVPHHFDIGSIEGSAFDGEVPWNYLWDGRCENCGHDFSIAMHQKIHTSEKDRYTTVKASTRWIERNTSDDLIGLSGVEIEQYNGIDGVNKIFISTNELKYLINAIKGSPLLEQLDWLEDRT